MIAAVKSHDHARVKKLLTEQDINARYSDGKSLIHVVVESKDVPLLELILANKDINVNARDDNGNTALHIAAKLNVVDAIALFVKDERCLCTIINLEGMIPCDCVTTEEAFNLLKIYSNGQHQMTSFIPPKKSTRVILAPDMGGHDKKIDVFTKTQRARRDKNLAPKPQETSSMCAIL